MAVERILILGGYGNFGKRIAENLSNFKDLTILIAGRSSQKAERLCDVLTAKGGRTLFNSAVMDIHAPDFSAQLSSLSPDLVIHTSGPFQGQGYHVAEACMAVGCHYIDLADDRRYVSDISKLDYEAKKQDVLLVAGASSVPGLSSTVIDELINQFEKKFPKYNFLSLSFLDFVFIKSFYLIKLFLRNTIKFFAKKLKSIYEG